MVDIVIIGAGTAGLTAAIYGLRAGKQVLVLEQISFGGQILNALEVENYPGIKKVGGVAFAKTLLEQVEELGGAIITEQVISVEDQRDYKIVKTKENTYKSKTVIVATGVQKRKLGLLREEELTGKGVSYCATRDGAFFKGKIVAVVGGGNIALDDAMFLSNYCKKVYVIHRRKVFRGEERTLRNLMQRDNVEFIYDSVVEELYATDSLKAIRIQNVLTKEETKIEVDGLFIAVGQVPDLSCVKDVIELDEQGFGKADESCRTNVDGIYVAGDCRTKEVRQLVTAVADGAVAALAASRNNLVM